MYFQVQHFFYNDPRTGKREEGTSQHGGDAGPGNLTGDGDLSGDAKLLGKRDFDLMSSGYAYRNPKGKTGLSRRNTVEEENFGNLQNESAENSKNQNLQGEKSKIRENEAKIAVSKDSRENLGDQKKIVNLESLGTSKTEKTDLEKISCGSKGKITSAKIDPINRQFKTLSEQIFEKKFNLETFWRKFAEIYEKIKIPHRLLVRKLEKKNEMVKYFLEKIGQSENRKKYKGLFDRIFGHDFILKGLKREMRGFCGDLLGLADFLSGEKRIGVCEKVNVLYSIFIILN